MIKFQSAHERFGVVSGVQNLIYDFENEGNRTYQVRVVEPLPTVMPDRCIGDKKCY
jgi:hypothetical protein